MSVPEFLDSVECPLEPYDPIIKCSLIASCFFLWSRYAFCRFPTFPFPLSQDCQEMLNNEYKRATGYYTLQSEYLLDPVPRIAHKCVSSQSIRRGAQAEGPVR